MGKDSSFEPIQIIDKHAGLELAVPARVYESMLAIALRKDHEEAEEICIAALGALGN